MLKITFIGDELSILSRFKYFHGYRLFSGSGSVSEASSGSESVNLFIMRIQIKPNKKMIPKELHVYTQYSTVGMFEVKQF